MRVAPLLVLTALAFTARPAWACGGMFCDVALPVDQAAERIFFFYEDDDDGDGLGTVTTEVQIAYTGESEDFAWVVPVPGEPDVRLSNDAMFTAIANQTTPTFQVIRSQTGSFSFGCATDQSLSFKADSAGAMEDGEPGVSVVSSEAVGPYDSVVLQAQNADLLVAWLEENGYDLPDGLDAVLQPYVAADQYFVALKLQSDKDAGDIAPISMTYPAAAASIPIQLTAVAAVDDMPIEVFVFGPSRAVPDNYLHVNINEAAINWYEGADNYREVVGDAVDEAGGLAFATDYAGPASDFDGVVYFPGQVPVDQMRSYEPIPWLESIVYSGLPGSTQLTNLLLDLVPPPAGVDGTSFLSCPGCYTVSVEGWDADEATDRLLVEVLDVMAVQQMRIDRASWATRLFTTMDPGEMTADPVFVFNADLDQTVVAAHRARSTERVTAFSGEVVSRTLRLDDGRAINVPHGDDFAAVYDTLGTPAALRIRDFGASGEGEDLFDHRADALIDADGFNAGCSDEAAVAAPLALLALGFLRRRRA